MKIKVKTILRPAICFFFLIHYIFFTGYFPLFSLSCNFVASASLLILLTMSPVFSANAVYVCLCGDRQLLVRQDTVQQSLHDCREEGEQMLYTDEEKLTVSREKLLPKAKELCMLLKYEFIFAPVSCENSL